jgi:GNAT superfamily N-acetyltransferase
MNIVCFSRSHKRRKPKRGSSQEYKHPYNDPPSNHTLTIRSNRMNPTFEHPQDQTNWTIRRAQARDVPGLVVLCAQLGYPVIDSQLKIRLEAILRLDHHAIYVAVDREDEILAWVHLFERPLLIQAQGAELGGLVVEQRIRGMGIGKALLLAAEQ